MRRRAVSGTAEPGPEPSGQPPPEPVPTCFTSTPQPPTQPPQSTQPPQQSTTSLAAWAIAVAALSVVPFTGSLHGDFLYDDLNIIGNEVVNGGAPAWDAWTTDFWGLLLSSRFSHKSYRPLAVLTFRWTAAWFGVDDPFPYHVACVALHTLNSVLVLGLGTALLPAPAARLGAAVFAVHPLHTETVTSVTYRADLLSAAFVLAALWTYVRCEAANGWARSGALHAVSVLLAVAATLCKEQGVTVMGVFVVYDVCCAFVRQQWGGAKWRRVLFRGAVTTAAVGCVVGVRLWLNNGPPPAWSNEDNIVVDEPSPLGRHLTLQTLMGMHMAWLVWPVTLCHDWNFRSLTPVLSFGDPRNLYWVAMHAALVSASVYALHGLVVRRSIAPPPCPLAPPVALSPPAATAVCAATIVLPFLPASNLFFPVGFTLAERVMYTPSIGFCWLVGLWVHRGGRGRPLAAAALRLVCAAVIVAGALHTYRRSCQFVNFETLLRADAEANPTNAKNWYSLAHQHHLREEFDDAERLYLKALDLQPHYPEPLLNLANIAIFGRKDHTTGEARYKLLVDRMVESTPDLRVGDRNHVALFSMVALELSAYASGRGDAEASQYYVDVTQLILSHVDPSVQDSGVVLMLAERLGERSDLPAAEVWFARVLQGKDATPGQQSYAAYMMGQIAEVLFREQQARGAVQEGEYVYRRQDALLLYEDSLRLAAGTDHGKGAAVRLAEFQADFPDGP